MLVGVIQKNTWAELEKQASQIDPDLYDLLELRLDACQDLSIPALGKLKPRLPAILTLRAKQEGGAFAGSEAERLTLLEQIAALRPAYLDLEAFLAQADLERLRAVSPQTQIILSKHDFDATPADLEPILAEMRAKAPWAIHKIAVMAANSLDALRLMVFCRERTLAGDKLIGISMGQSGQTSRILAPWLHTGFCYCPVDLGAAGAPGQLAAAELRELYNFKNLNRESAVYGLLGDPVDQSLGHVFHNRLNRQRNLNAVYVKWRAAKEELPLALTLLHRLGVQGLSLTMPHKEAAVPLLESIAQTAWRIGAVNTLSRTAHGWQGTNTDGQGALASLGFDPSGRHLAVLGAGGAAKAIIFAALQAGARLSVFNRSMDRSLPGKLRPKAFSRLHELRDQDYAAIINTLPFDTEFPYAAVPWRQGSLALDISYNKDSKFLRQAAMGGCRIQDGLRMFEEQGALQRKVWGLDP